MAKRKVPNAAEAEEKRRIRNLAPFKELGFVATGESGGDEATGDCPFCGKEKKFTVNLDSQLFRCLSAQCGLSGNLTTFIREFFRKWEEETTDAVLESLSEQRGLPVEALKSAGIVFDGLQFVIPVRNENGTYVQARRYDGKVLRGLTGVDPALFGAEELASDAKADWPIFHTEGEWDGIAMRCLLADAGEKGIATASPGAGVFPEKWAPLFSGRDFNAFYDHDEAGRKGLPRVYGQLDGVVRTFQAVSWPSELPTGFDVRDFYLTGKTLSDLLTLVKPYEPGEEADDNGKGRPNRDPDARGYSFPLLRDGGRPTFEETLAVYRKHLHMTEELRQALRLCYAVVYSNQIEGDPVWAHLAGVPGCGKTQLISSLERCPNTVMRSSISAHTLVSGWGFNGGPDMSLLPLLVGPPPKVFVLKDFTEILKSPKVSKDEIYKTLRGAYDRTVATQFGGPAGTRRYRGHFAMLTGVTPEIYAEAEALVGERFLIFHIRVGRDAEDIIMAAIETVGNEDTINEEIQEAAAAFLCWKIEKQDYPEVPREYKVRIAHLCQLVAMLRAGVRKERLGSEERVVYRPEYELGSRLAKQLVKLLMGLALQNTPVRVTEDDYKIVVRTALNSCNGWNLEIFRLLSQREGVTVRILSDESDIPESTLKDHIVDMALLGVLERTRHLNPASIGRPTFRYRLSEKIRQHWEKAKLGEPIPAVPLEQRSPRAAKRAATRLPRVPQVAEVSQNGRTGQEGTLNEVLNGRQVYRLKAITKE
jgi:hypothetical protein